MSSAMACSTRSLVTQCKVYSYEPVSNSLRQHLVRRREAACLVGVPDNFREPFSEPRSRFFIPSSRNPLRAATVGGIHGPAEPN
jgi:hypothetical protein